jgi:post-segregation antitoxin (ccd killing protein)
MATKTTSKATTKKVKMTRINIYVPEDFYTEFKKKSIITDQTISEYIREAIKSKQTEEQKARELRSKKFLKLAGSLGSFGDPLAWSKIDEIYDF